MEEKKKAGRPKKAPKVVEPKEEKVEQTIVEPIIPEPVVPEPKVEEYESTPPWEPEPIIAAVSVEQMNEVIEENISSSDPIEIEVVVNDSVVGDQTGLSPQAANWEKWLAYQRMSPETWLAKYPTNKFKHFVQEIVDKRAKN